MLLNFCAGARVKAILQHLEAAVIIKHAGNILQKCRETQGDTSFDADISLLHGVKSDRPSLDTNSADEETMIPRELEDVLTDLGVTYRETGVRAYKRCHLSGIQFTTHKASRTDCYIFFKDGGDLRPGRIDMLFGIKLVGGREEHFAAVHRNLPITEGTEDPFRSYADFGARLWREDYANDLCIVPFLKGEIYHAISMPWVNGILVVKPLDRVSNRPTTSQSNSPAQQAFNGVTEGEY